MFVSKLIEFSSFMTWLAGENGGVIGRGITCVGNVVMVYFHLATISGCFLRVFSFDVEFPFC